MSQVLSMYGSTSAGMDIGVARMPMTTLQKRPGYHLQEIHSDFDSVEWQPATTRHCRCSHANTEGKRTRRNTWRGNKVLFPRAVSHYRKELLWISHKKDSQVCGEPGRIGSCQIRKTPETVSFLFASILPDRFWGACYVRKYKFNFRNREMRDNNVLLLRATSHLFLKFEEFPY